MDNWQKEAGNHSAVRGATNASHVAYLQKYRIFDVRGFWGVRALSFATLPGNQYWDSGPVMCSP